MKLYLHIGTEKTATTAIQESLHLNRNTLAEQGIWISETGGKTANRELATACMDPDRYDDHHMHLNVLDASSKAKFFLRMRSELEHEINSLDSKIKAVVISSEHFHSRTVHESEIQTVRKLLSGLFFSVEIICYVREQSQTCESLYSTSIKAGNINTLEQMAQECIPTNPYYNYYDMLSRWKSVFSGAKYTVRTFDRSQFKNESCVDDFYSIIGIEDLRKFSKVISNTNESLSFPGQLMGRIINHLCHTAPNSSPYIKSKSKLTSLLFDKFRGSGEKLSVQERQSIYTQFQYSNTKLCEEFTGGVGNCFAAPSEFDRAETSFTQSDVENLSQFITLFSNSGNLSSDDAKVLHDSAVALEKVDLAKSTKLMEIASLIKPDGPAIKQKLMQYEQRSVANKNYFKGKLFKLHF